MTPSNYKVSIGIVTYNNSDIITKTLDDLLKYFEGPIYIFDNNSSDETQNILTNYTQKHSNIYLDISRDNLGFGKGHNRIIENVNSDYHIIYNPDIHLESNIFPNLISFMVNAPQVAISVPKVLNPDGSIQHLNKQLPNIFDLFLRRFSPRILKKIFQKRMDWYEMKEKSPNQQYDVPSLTGCFMVSRTNAIKQVGGFDDRYFMYFEDVDLGRKVRKMGYKTTYNPTATVTHLWARESHKNWRMTFVMIQNAIRYFNKWGWKLY